MADSQTAQEIYALIRQAILAKDIVALNYRGSVREMCPHVLGKTKGAPIRPDVSICWRDECWLEARRIARQLALHHESTRFLTWL